MTDDRKSGLALIAGSVAMIITMGLHPGGPVAPGKIEPVIRMLIAVHTLALLTAPVLFLGALGLSRRLSSPDRLGIAALVLYGFAMVAVVSSAVTDGLVSPNLLRQIVSTSPPASDLWRALFRYNGYVDAAFAEVFIVASSLAVTLWSAAILRNRALARGLGIFGAVIGPLAVIAVFSGVLKFAPHGLGLVVVAEAFWFMISGALLARADPV